MQSSSYERFAGALAILAGVIGFLYSLAFIVIEKGIGGILSALSLTLGGLLTKGC